jgi:hypothetical protein
MQQLVAPLAACLNASQTEDDAYASPATTSQHPVKSSEDENSPTRVLRRLASDNQDEDDAALDEDDSSQRKFPSEPHTELTATAMGLQPLTASACVPTPGSIKSGATAPSSGTLVDGLLAALER